MNMFLWWPFIRPLCCSCVLPGLTWAATSLHKHFISPTVTQTLTCVELCKRKKKGGCVFSWRQTEVVLLRDTNAANHLLSQLWVWFQKLRVAASISPDPRLTSPRLQSAALLRPSDGVFKGALSRLHHPGVQGGAAHLLDVWGDWLFVCFIIIIMNPDLLHFVKLCCTFYIFFSHCTRKQTSAVIQDFTAAVLLFLTIQQLLKSCDLWGSLQRRSL